MSIPDQINDMLHVTHGELKEEILTVMKYVAQQMETSRDQIYHLHKTAVVAGMAVEIYKAQPTWTNAACAAQAKTLYKDVQRTLEIDDTICTPIKGH